MGTVYSLTFTVTPTVASQRFVVALETADFQFVTLAPCASLAVNQTCNLLAGNRVLIQLGTAQAVGVARAFTVQVQLPAFFSQTNVHFYSLNSIDNQVFEHTLSLNAL